MSTPGEQTGMGPIYTVIGTDQHGNPVHEEVQETPLSRSLAVALADRPGRTPEARVYAERLVRKAEAARGGEG